MEMSIKAQLSKILCALRLSDNNLVILGISNFWAEVQSVFSHYDISFEVTIGTS